MYTSEMVRGDIDRHTRRTDIAELAKSFPINLCLFIKQSRSQCTGIEPRIMFISSFPSVKSPIRPYAVWEGRLKVRWKKSKPKPNMWHNGKVGRP
ncbi:hypothetical protein VNO77_03758 [Canavalia gladiata]|uniref:Uncharacterized protein n=1 Tax=Canavalia gladiata TaxID=3824 RepID=A0AAN9R8F7_CANGL